MIEAVRSATAGDRTELSRLEGDAFEATAEQRGGPELLAGAEPPSDERWTARLADPTRLTLLATIDDVPVGVLTGRLVGVTLRVELIWVDPGAREVGLGDELLVTAMAEGRSRGATAIEALALPGDRATKNLFERFGVKARAIIVHRRLEEPATEPATD